MQANDNLFDILDPKLVKLTNTCGVRYLRHILFQVIQEHPELSDQINDMLIEAHSNQDNDKENSLLYEANFPCYPNHYRLEDFDPACLSEKDAEIYKGLTKLSFLSSPNLSNVLIHGLVGQGREKVAIGLGDACCKQQQKTSYTTYSDLIGTLRTHCTSSRDNKTYTELVGSNVLIIDNFSEETIFDTEILDILTTFLRQRALTHREKFIAHKHGDGPFAPCCTIVTSAFEPAEWPQYMQQDVRKSLSISHLFHEKYALSIHVDEMNMPSDEKQSDES